MSFYEISDKILNEAFTENGDKAYKTTGSFCLDYFSLVGGMRYNLTDALNLFMKSYYEDPILTIKILFYTRDIRAGLGERDLFRYAFNALANMYPSVAKQLIKYVPEYGRYDDLLVLLDSSIKNDVLLFIKNQLEIDINNKKEGRPISLLAKWLPSINTSSSGARKYASIIASYLGMKQVDYRKMLSFLRRELIIENNLREEDYSFEYPTIPGGAMFKYKNVFLTKDSVRYKQYLEDLSRGKVKINTNTLFPYEVIRRFEKRADPSEYPTLDAIWKNFDRTKINSKTIVVRDGSGSMYDGNSVSANSVATSLAILFAEQLTGTFKDTFITFSSRPQIIKIKGETIEEKYKFISTFDEVSNTNLANVFKLILKVYNHQDFNKEDMLDRIVIISDMEFDCVEGANLSTYELFKSELETFGFKIPEIVYWNVRARSIHFPVMNDIGVKLVSGASNKIIEMITNHQETNPYQFMIECLKKYSIFDEIKI